MNTAREEKQPPRPRTIHSCNFRYAGRLSNENARALTALHEKFALNVTNSLELYLGTSLRLKLLSLEQMAILDYTSKMGSNSYLLPCSLNVMESNFLMEMDIALIFPIIDLLLGGAGTASEDTRELTDIDEEIMQSVTALIIKEVERSWRTLNLSLTPGRCIKPAMIQQVFLANEKLVLLMFEMTLGGTHWTIQHRAADIVCRVPAEALESGAVEEDIEPSAFPESQSSRADSRLRLHCSLAEITQMRVVVKDRRPETGHRS